jgi:hypothetical protein
MSHERIIDELFTQEERPLVHAIVDQCLQGLHQDRRSR